MKNKCQLVRTLSNVKPFVIYQTKNYNLLKVLSINRGEDKGVDEDRVRKLMTIMVNGDFHFELAVVIVNRKGEIIDGASRFTAMKNLELPVYFRVVFEEKYNKGVSESAVIMAQYNGTNPTWTAKQQFKTALACKNPLAELLREYRGSAIVKINELTEQDLSVNFMMTLVERNAKKTHSTKRNFTEYFNTTYYEYAKSEQFKKEFAYVCNIISILKDCSVDTNRVVEQVLFLMWSDTSFNAPRFQFNLQYVCFDLIGKVTAKVIREKIYEIANMEYQVKKVVSIF